MHDYKNTKLRNYKTVYVFAALLRLFERSDVRRPFFESFILWFVWTLPKNYLRYKSDNFSKYVIWGTGSEFFYFVEKLCSVLKIFKGLYFKDPMVCQICDVMMSISKWDRVHFWVYLSIHYVTKPFEIIDISKGNSFRKSFEQFGELGLRFRSFQI